MAKETKVIGWIQLIGGIATLWAAWSGNWVVGLGVLGLIFVTLGYWTITSHK